MNQVGSKVVLTDFRFVVTGSRDQTFHPNQSSSSIRIESVMLFKVHQPFIIRSFLLALMCIGTGAGAVFGQKHELVSFEMQDQFEEVHSSGALKNKATVFIIADREGSPASAEWGTALSMLNNQRSNTSAVEIRAIAHMQGVPSLLRPFVRRLIRRERSNPVLLDWAGQFEKAYSIQPGQANILVFDAAGALHIQIASTGVNPIDLDRVNSQISLLVE